MMKPESRTDVLVVDDEEVVCRGIARILEGHGLSVAAAQDVQTALAHPALAACRLVLCDLLLPDGSGLSVLRELKTRRADLPVVMITGYATPASLEQAAGAGVAGWLPKPFDEEELMAVVRRVLGTQEEEA